MAKVRKFLFGIILKFFSGCLMLWLSAVAVCVVGSALPQVPWGETPTWVFLGGFAAYFAVHFLLSKPILTHVMAHELTHALAAMALGGKVTSIQASTSGGTTVTNRSHLFVSLAPYIFPFYTAVTLMVYAIAADRFKVYLLFLVGFTYAFHLALTVWSLSHHQPDLDEGGVAFSLIFIFTGNMIVLMLLFTFVWPQALPLSAVFSGSLSWSHRFGSTLFHFLKPYFVPPEAKP
ncbi:MAG TPA: hypothetical protein VHE12_02495 [bacterium]|nr:hypothetical protein [bacterium]